MSRNKNKRKRKRKLAAHSVVGTWLGVYLRTGEHVIEVADGTPIRVRTITVWRKKTASSRKPSKL